MGKLNDAILRRSSGTEARSQQCCFAFAAWKKLEPDLPADEIGKRKEAGHYSGLSHNTR